VSVIKTDEADLITLLKPGVNLQSCGASLPINEYMAGQSWGFTTVLRQRAISFFIM